MRLTQVLHGPPVFHFWKDFGAGKKRRIPYFKQWKSLWRSEIARKKVADHTLSLDKLPSGSRIMQAEDFMDGPIDALPDELIRRKNEKIIYDHPWPYNVQLDPIKSQKLMYCYTIDSRFFVPRHDSQVLTNTILETDQLEACPPIEPTADHIETIERQYDWATKGDSVLVRLPRKREWPKINIRPSAKYGLTKERKEVNIMNTMYDYTQTILAKYYHELGNREKLGEILARRFLAYPHCQVPFERESQNINLDLFIDSMSLSHSPLPQIATNPQETRNREPVNIEPRSWKSILEKSRQYSPAWSFTLPPNAHLHTIQLASRIKREHRDADEMLARSLIHAFGLTGQFARLRAYEKSARLNRTNESNKQASCVLHDPMGFREVDDKDLLDQPIVLQTISYDFQMGNFHFMRYQLNSLKFDDKNPERVKNQAWHSGPISDLGQALRYYLDFQSCDSSIVSRMTSERAAQCLTGSGQSSG